MFKNMSIKKRLILLAIIVVIFGLLSPTPEEKKANEEKRMVALKVEVLNISKLDINKNLEAYKKLSKFYKDDNKYINKYNKYKKLNDIQTYCLAKSVSLNKGFLNNPNTYNNERFKFSKWLNENEYITNFEFTGKNAFNVEYKFNSQYKCKIIDIENDKVTIETTFINKI